MKYSGVFLDLAKSISHVAHGGQIVISDATRLQLPPTFYAEKKAIIVYLVRVWSTYGTRMVYACSHRAQQAAHSRQRSCLIFMLRHAVRSYEHVWDTQRLCTDE